MTGVPFFYLTHNNDWSRFFVIRNFSPIFGHPFSFMGGVEKKMNN
jgi:hypothetical protein